MTDYTIRTHFQWDDDFQAQRPWFILIGGENKHYWVDFIYG
jgi:hypothetical protein